MTAVFAFLAGVAAGWPLAVIGRRLKRVGDCLRLGLIDDETDTGDRPR